MAQTYLRKNEVGRRVRLGTGGFDVSGKSALTITLTPPSGSTNAVTVADARITVDSSAYSGEGESYLANESIYFDTLSTDFDETGTYSICFKYEDSTPKEYYSAPATVTVQSKCGS